MAVCVCSVCAVRVSACAVHVEGRRTGKVDSAQFLGQGYVLFPCRPGRELKCFCRSLPQTSPHSDSGHLRNALHLPNGSCKVHCTLQARQRGSCSLSQTEQCSHEARRAALEIPRVGLLLSHHLRAWQIPHETPWESRWESPPWSAVWETSHGWAPGGLTKPGGSPCS